MAWLCSHFWPPGSVREMGLCFWDNPEALRASFFTLSFFLFLFSYKLPDFRGQAGAQEGFVDRWLCSSWEPSVVSDGDAGSPALPTFWRPGLWTSWAGPALLQGRGPGCPLWSDPNNSTPCHQGSGATLAGVYWPALLMCFGSLFPFWMCFLKNKLFDIKKKQFMVFRMLIWNKANIGDMLCR